MLDGRLDEPFWAKRGARRQLHPAGPAERRPRHRADRSAHRLRRRIAVHGRHLLRLRARQVARLPAPARRVPQLRRPLHVDHRYVPRRPHRLLLRDEPLGADGRLAPRDQRRKPGMGRHLERAGAAQRDRLDARDRDPVPHAQLQSQQRHLGHQLPAHRAAQERRQHLDGLGAQPGASPDDQRRPRHRHPRRDAGARPRHQAVRRLRVGGIAGARQLRDHRRRERRDRSLLQSRRRCCAPSSPSTPTSRRPKSISARST